MSVAQTKRLMISVEESLAAWRKDPEYIAACNARASITAEREQ